MGYLFTSESVSEGHPDKVADQISDAVLDSFLAFDPQSKVACETLVTTGLVVIAGEVKSKAYIDLQEVARGVIENIGYDKAEYRFDAASCGVLSAIHEQSPDINQGVDRANTGFCNNRTHCDLHLPPSDERGSRILRNGNLRTGWTDRRLHRMGKRHRKWC